MFKSSQLNIKLCKFFTYAVVFAFIAVAVTSNPADAARRRSGKNHKFAEIVMDASTGRVLSAQNADKRLYPASLTKMMTLYLVFEAKG